MSINVCEDKHQVHELYIARIVVFGYLHRLDVEGIIFPLCRTSAFVDPHSFSCNCCVLVGKQMQHGFFHLKLLCNEWFLYHVVLSGRFSLPQTTLDRSESRMVRSTFHVSTSSVQFVQCYLFDCKSDAY